MAIKLQQTKLYCHFLRAARNCSCYFYISIILLLTINVKKSARVLNQNASKFPVSSKKSCSKLGATYKTFILGLLLLHSPSIYYTCHSYDYIF